MTRIDFQRRPAPAPHAADPHPDHNAAPRAAASLFRSFDR